MKKALFSLLLVIIAFLIIFTSASCGKNIGNNNTENETCKITFANTDFPEQTVEKGSTLSKPSNPSKDGSVFVDWYSDATFSNKVVFPITVNSDTTLYARYYTYEDAFIEARKNTLGDSVSGYSYNHQTEIKVFYSNISFEGKTVGSSKYSTIGDVNFYDESVNSGALLPDGSKYQIRRGTTLQEISLDSNGMIKSFSSKEVGNDFKYNSSSLAKAVFEYSDERLKSISPTDKPNVYKINTTVGASDIIATIANTINHPMIEKLLCELPETAADTCMYVVFDGDKINSYIYEFKVNVTGLQFDLKYTLEFTDIGVAQTITPKDFKDVAASPTDIEVLTTEAAKIINTFKSNESSGYSFNAESGVDFGIQNSEIKSTFKGSAFRKIQDNTIFFYNDIEIDSDFKNKNLYKNCGIDDIHIKQTKLSNGDVYLIEKKLLVDKVQKLDDFTDSELTSFYLLDVLNQSSAYSFAQKNSINAETIYTFGLTNAGASTLLEWLNSSLDLDPLGTATADALVFGKFNESSLMLDEGIVTIIVNADGLQEIDVTIEGNTATSFENSVEFSNENDAKIEFDLTITVDSNGSSFEPFENVDDAK